MRAAPALVLGVLVGCAPALGMAAGDDWRTPAELSAFETTPRYEETLAYLRRLEKASPWLRVTSFGKGGEGRDLILVVASKDRAFDPAAAAKTAKVIVLLQAGIHAGEIDGKDAGMMLLRDMAVTRERAALLERAIFLFMPIYNVDGHERFGPFNRINQNGPKEMGWRTTSRNLNLNRDYMKADAVETRAWLRAFDAWRPDLLIDAHVTDGADYQYDLTYVIESGPNVPRPIAEWVADAVEGRVIPAFNARGHLSSPYVFLKDEGDLSKGLVGGVATPRFSTGYSNLQNRPGFLIETHMLKDFRTRVAATYDVLIALLEEINRAPEALRSAVRRADADAARPGRLPLLFENTDKARRVTFKGVEYRRAPSEISGGMMIAYGSSPIDLELDRFDDIKVTLEVQKPLAYVVPPQWTEVIEVLRLHGLKTHRLAEAASPIVEGYHLSAPKWQEQPFEGRHPVTFKTDRLPAASRPFPAGSIVVPLDQRASAVAVHLLEPQGTDALVSWGFFDAIFEQKEFGEPYVVERMAREMLEKDPALRAQFEEAISDPAFAGDPRKRLDFFYRRSPYWDERIGLYPVGLITSPDVMERLRIDRTAGR